MRAVIQRVREAEVTVDGTSVGRIGRGLVVLAGLARDDGDDDIAWMARKIAGLRVFDDGTTERSVVEIGGTVLAVSQFTLLADCRKGRRPSYDHAMPAEAATALFARFRALRALRARAAVGRRRRRDGIVRCGHAGANRERRSVHLGHRFDSRGGVIVRSLDTGTLTLTGSSRFLY
jgi:D-tyrosyl-tRNA(Tyr) deacylase